MTASQRTGYTKRRKQIWEALHPEDSKRQRVAVLDNDLEVGTDFPPQVFEHGGARPQVQGFAASTAEASGMTKRSINQHLARADALGDDVERITGTSYTLDAG